MTDSESIRPRGKGAFVVSLIFNTIGAVLLPAILGYSFQFRHTAQGLLWKEIAFSILVAAAFGVVQGARESDAAAWVWVCPAIWLACGLLMRRTEFSFPSFPEYKRTIIFFYGFTIPFARCLAFSVAAIGARLMFSQRDRSLGL
jgi:hypothetical protein